MKSYLLFLVLASMPSLSFAEASCKNDVQSWYLELKSQAGASKENDGNKEGQRLKRIYQARLDEGQKIVRTLKIKAPGQVEFAEQIVKKIKTVEADLASLAKREPLKEKFEDKACEAVSNNKTLCSLIKQMMSSCYESDAACVKTQLAKQQQALRSGILAEAARTYKVNDGFRYELKDKKDGTFQLAISGFFAGGGGDGEEDRESLVLKRKNAAMPSFEKNTRKC